MSAAGVAVVGVILILVGWLVPVAPLVWVGGVCLVVALVLLLVGAVPHRRP